MAEHLWSRTPLIESSALSKVAGCRIFLKLENFQPSGSFKYRGTSHLMQSALQTQAPESRTSTHFYCSSGGNAGIACATAAKSMNLAATVVVPTSTSSFMVSKLRDLGADIHQIGANWSEADRYLRENLLAHDPNGVYIPPFDHPMIWEGSSSMLEEVYEQMENEGGFDGVVCSVGGGSLLTGIMTAIERHSDKSWLNVPRVLAVETKGSESLNMSLCEGRHVTLPKITSIATSLGIVRVARRAYELAQQPNVNSIVISDAEAAMGSVRFAEDEDMLIEVSCGAALAAVYNSDLRNAMGADLDDQAWRSKKFVVAVCGGSDVTPTLLQEYRERYSAAAPSMSTNSRGWVDAVFVEKISSRIQMESCLHSTVNALQVA